MNTNKVQSSLFIQRKLQSTTVCQRKNSLIQLFNSLYQFRSQHCEVASGHVDIVVSVRSDYSSSVKINIVSTVLTHLNNYTNLKRRTSCPCCHGVFLVLCARWWLSVVSQNSCAVLRSLKMPSNEPAVSSRTAEVTV